jgi:hypothetical protein
MINPRITAMDVYELSRRIDIAIAPERSCGRVLSVKALLTTLGTIECSPINEAICGMNPAIRLVGAVLPFAVLGFSSFVLILRMIEMVNLKLPKDQQIEYAYSYPVKIRKIRALYREHYPTGHLAMWEIGVEAVGAVWCLIVAVMLLHSN